MTSENQVALVTGASRGIGQAIAIELGKQGITVIGTATSEKGAENITAYLSENGISGKGMILNVTEISSVDELMKSIKD
ncbi:MAG: SDR family NAD(P)-dependent oxidoreductase, partial [Pseudomonadota bacterium]